MVARGLLDDLSVEFRKNQLPLAVDLMMGLPGATVDALRNDIQECVNRNVRAIHDLDLGVTAYAKALARLGYSLAGRRSQARRRLYGTAPDPAILAHAATLVGRRGADIDGSR